MAVLITLCAYLLGIVIVGCFIYAKTSWRKTSSLKNLRYGFFWLIFALTLLAACSMLAFYQVEWYWFLIAAFAALPVSLIIRGVLFDWTHRLHNRRH